MGNPSVILMGYYPSKHPKSPKVGSSRIGDASRRALLVVFTARLRGRRRVQEHLCASGAVRAAVYAIGVLVRYECGAGGRC